MSDDMNFQTPQPEWFKANINTPYQARDITVEGCRIHYQVWGDADKPGVLLAPAHASHTHWWDCVAPALLNEYQVAAIDFSGLGDSGHREDYPGDLHAQEMLAVCEDAGFDQPLLVGHSFGGFASIRAGFLFGDKLRGIIVIDPPIKPPDYDWAAKRDPGNIKIKHYPSFDVAWQRFRPLPEQDCEPYLLEYIGKHSVKSVEEGWIWKYDPMMTVKTDLYPTAAQHLMDMSCPAGVIYGGDSRLFKRNADYVKSILKSDAPFICVPDAGHHLWLGHPLEFIEALKQALTLLTK